MTNATPKLNRPPGRPRAPEPFVSTTVGIPASAYRQILALSGCLSRSKSDVIRAALAEYLEPRFAPRRLGPRCAPRDPSPEGARAAAP